METTGYFFPVLLHPEPRCWRELLSRWLLQLWRGEALGVLQCPWKHEEFLGGKRGLVRLGCSFHNSKMGSVLSIICLASMTNTSSKLGFCSKTIYYSYVPDRALGETCRTWNTGSGPRKFDQTCRVRLGMLPTQQNTSRVSFVASVGLITWTDGAW